MCPFKVTAIVPSAGRGMRFKSRKRKVFANLNRKPLLSYTLKTLQSYPPIRDIVLVMNHSLLDAAKKLVRRYRITKVRHIVKGGKTRTKSVRKGLDCVDKDTSLVLIHDGVRPFVSKKILKKTIRAAKRFGASVSAVPLKSTVKVSKKDFFVKYTPDRARLWEIQTPQVFKKDLIEEAYKKIRPNKLFTDDAALVEDIGAKVKIIKGNYNNIKITTTEDIKIAEALLNKRNQKPVTRNQN